METWMLCRDFPKYEVSPEGYLKNRERDTPVSTRQNRQGIVMANLMDEDSRKRTRSVALIVAQTYLRQPPHRFYNSVIHLNGDKSDCSALNLMWRPRWYALNYHNMFNKPPINVSVMIEETGEIFGTLRDACIKYGLHEEATYYDMLTGHACFHYGYRFLRAECQMGY